jgi:hypothetical protein
MLVSFDTSLAPCAGTKLNISRGGVVVTVVVGVDVSVWLTLLDTVLDCDDVAEIDTLLLCVLLADSV